ncbi:hypothetical protein D9756_007741 [Leucocoprinus leucothites]|uniref:Transmembrane protein n=1 Tax=Leucocoprinus leucothites TaxID=201217 RepID=A0A8H5D241_9AGAR|nr:hypothetical protein D9756_007741 [Leucoagaricus leucothites]
MTTYSEDFSAYINYDACDVGGRTKPRSRLRTRGYTREDPILLASSELGGSKPWEDTIAPGGTTMFIQSPSGSIFRSSGSLEQPSEANSQSTLLSINGSAGPSYSPTAFGHYLLPQDARSAQSKHHRGAASQPTSPVFLKSNSSGNWDSVPSVESPAYWVTDFGHQLTLNPSPASSTCSSASSLYGTRQTPSPASSAASSSSSIAWSNNGSRVRIKSQRRHCSDRDPYERNTALRMPSLTTTIDDSSPIFQWLPSSSWYAALSGHDNSTSSYYMSTSTFSNSSNANVTFTFAGHSIQVYGRKTEKHGFYQVQIDDKVYPQIDGSGSPQGLRQLLFSEDGLGEGVHSVIMKNLDDTKLLAIDYVTWQSYIGKPDSKDELTVKTVQDTNPDIKYQGSWRTNPSNLGTFFGGTGHVSTEAGSSLQYSFTGGAIALFGPSGPRGASYSVQLDNEAPQNFSFYSPQDIPQSTLYFRGGLSTGKRTLKVTYTGSASDENGNLAIDYMNVFTTNTIESLASNRLSPSAIAAITVGTFAFILLFLLSLYYCLRQEKGWNDSEGIGRLFNLGWWNRMTKGKKMTPRGFDLDEGGDYGAAGVSEREGEYLISSLGSPGVSEAIRLGEVRNEVGVGMGMGNLSVHLNAFSDTSRSPSHLTGNIRHHMQQSSLSGLSVLNQPLVRTRSSVDVESSSVASNGNGSEGTQEQSEFSVPLPEYSASQGTLVPSATMIVSLLVVALFEAADRSPHAVSNIVSPSQSAIERDPSSRGHESKAASNSLNYAVTVIKHSLRIGAFIPPSVDI